MKGKNNMTKTNRQPSKKSAKKPEETVIIPVYKVLTVKVIVSTSIDLSKDGITNILDILVPTTCLLVIASKLFV